MISAFHQLALAQSRTWLSYGPGGPHGFPFTWGPVPFLTSGTVLFLASFLLPKSKPRSANGLMIQKGGGMLLPKKWDEHQISLDIEKYRGDSGALGTYFEGIITRFVAGQQTRTVEARLKYLQSFNRYSEVAREAYKWKRYIEGGRATIEEDIEDIRVKVQLAKAQAELEEAGGDEELLKLQKEARRLEVQLEVARKKKALEDVNKVEPPPPPPPAPPQGLSVSERREKERAELKDSEKRVKDEIRIVQADPTLTDEQRRRKLNVLEERLDEINEQQVRLL